MEIIYFGKNFKLLKEDDLSDLLNVLSTYLPESLKFHQTLKTYLKDKVWNFYFYVSNNWPNEPICLHFPGVTRTVTDSIYDSMGLFCPLNRLDCLQQLLDENVLIDWTKTMFINYTHENIMKRIEQLYSKTGILNEKIYGDFYIYNDSIDIFENNEFQALQDNTEFKEIGKNDADLIHDLYPLREFESVLVFKRLIDKLPSCGVYVQGELVAWMIQSYYGAMFSMQTIPTYRRQGFGKLVARHLTRLVQSRGYIPFVVIIPENIISKNLYIKLGFKKLYRNIRALLRPYRNRKIEFCHMISK